MPLAAGFVGILPALTMLEKDKDGSDSITVDWFKAICWSLAIAFFGLVLGSIYGIGSLMIDILESFYLRPYGNK